MNTHHTVHAPPRFCLNEQKCLGKTLPPPDISRLARRLCTARLGEPLPIQLVHSLEVLASDLDYVSGGAIALLWAELQHSSIQVLHFRHEAGAAFAAVESYFASGCPVVVFTIRGPPGITNALTGLLATRWADAKVILLSPSTLTPQHGAGFFKKPARTRCPTRLFLPRDATLLCYHSRVQLATPRELSQARPQSGTTGELLSPS